MVGRRGAAARLVAPRANVEGGTHSALRAHQAGAPVRRRPQQLVIESRRRRDAAAGVDSLPGPHGGEAAPPHVDLQLRHARAAHVAAPPAVVAPAVCGEAGRPLVAELHPLPRGTKVVCVVVAAKAGDDAPLLERGEDARVRPVAADRLAHLARHWHPRSDRRLNLGRSRAINGNLGRSRASSQRPPPSLELGKSRQISARLDLGQARRVSRLIAISGNLGASRPRTRAAECGRRPASARAARSPPSRQTRRAGRR
mmetsp:Transcript_46643/g.154646  ORF Transcript_46643/g.154646 Transcript_46643/m.154646 type:complete len:256 (-) Transcript_46643:127-894(-)